MKITNETTLGQLALYKAQLGVMTVNVTTEGAARRALVHSTNGFHTCVADTEAEALDGAFQELVRAIGTELEMALS